jgi:hypothetical protein
MPSDAAHLVPDMSNRGFKHMPQIEGAYPGFVRVYESSAASAPHVWLDASTPIDLNNPEGGWSGAAVHLSMAGLGQLIDQLIYLRDHHYQNEAETPDAQR